MVHNNYRRNRFLVWLLKTVATVQVAIGRFEICQIKLKAHVMLVILILRPGGAHRLCGQIQAFRAGSIKQTHEMSCDQRAG